MKMDKPSEHIVLGLQKAKWEETRWTSVKSKRSRVNRRSFVKGVGRHGRDHVRHAVAGARPQGVPNEFDGSKFQLKAPEPNPKSGGVLRYAITSRPPHFDLHQSGTINSLGSQGCMFDNLIRRDPRDSGKTIIPDLAHSWEIAKDGKTYTFHLREGVQFHDGAEFTVRGREGDLRPHRQAAGGRQHPAQHAVHHGRARSTRRDKKTVDVQALRAAARQLHDGGLRQRLERASSARRRWRTTATTCAASSTSPAPARSRASAASRTKSG